ncbi:MAG: hypothetical protein ACI9W5_000595 [Ulvibacter sp.]
MQIICPIEMLESGLEILGHYTLEKWYKLEPDLFRVSPEEFKNTTYDKIEGSILKIGTTL